MDFQAAQLKDFLTVYNNMSETCFAQCVHTLNTRKLEDDEAKCVDYCVGKFVKFNHRLMQVYASVQGDIVKRRMKEAEEESAKALANSNTIETPAVTTEATETAIVTNQTSEQS